MGNGFYGNIILNKAETNFIFDIIYPNRQQMENEAQGDGVYLGRYVLVEYGIDEAYEINAQVDKEQYEGKTYDSTVWQKVSEGNKFIYKQIANLNTINPKFTIKSINPVDNPGNIKIEHNSEINSYEIEMPKPWGFTAKEPFDFNEDGFDSVIHNISDAENNISVNTAANQTQKELSITLPALGNSIAKVWDIVYGEAENGQPRNTVINWDSSSGLTLFNRNENGYSFNKENAATIAGCINSVQDLMGKIIVDDINSGNDPINVDEAGTAQIYYRKNDEGIAGFYIKDKTYELIPGEVNAEEAGELLNFELDKYYYKTSNGYAKEKEIYDSGRSYYDLTDLWREVPINSKPYEPNKYFERILNGYQFSTFPDFNDFDFDICYYEAFTFGEGQDVEQITDSIKKITDETKSLRLFFIPDKPPVNEGETFAGLFYLVDESKNYLPISTLSSYNDITDNMRFFWIQDYTIGDGIDINDNTPTQVYVFDDARKIPVTIVPTPDEYYTWDAYNGTLFVAEDKVHTKEYYKFNIDPESKRVDMFYRSDVYYYSKDNGDTYIYDVKTNTYQSDVTYYKLLEKPKDLKFYEPNKYYYQDGNTYILDTSAVKTDGRVYYNYSDQYVISDASNKMAAGAYWNSKNEVPEGVVVGGRKEIYVWKELKDFAHSLNTIHGLVIKINNILKTDDMITRDRNTVQGSINALNDIIDRLDLFEANKIVTTDAFGRLVGTTELAGLIYKGEKTLEQALIETGTDNGLSGSVEENANGFFTLII